jgi:hypothetical protein
MRMSYLVAALVLGLAVILGLQFRSQLFSGWGPFADPPPVIEPQVSVAPPVPGTAEQPALALPPAASAPEGPLPEERAPALPALDASDDWLRETLAPLAAPESWLAADQLLRRGATVLAALADGSVPRRSLSALVPADPFPATVANRGAAADNQLYYPDSAGYQRFDPLLGVLLSLPAERLASLYLTVEPLLDQAVGELGDGRTARDLLNGGLASLMATPVLASPPLLERPGVAYRYADAQLESLSDLQKQLLRMGPEHLVRLREYAQAFVLALTPEVSETPAAPGDDEA